MICPSAGSGGHPDNSSVIFYANDTGLQQFEKWWNKSKTVPFYLIGLLLPLLNFKSPSFFSKFNILGKLRHRVIEPLCRRIHAGFRGNMVWLGRELPSRPVRLSLICSLVCYPLFGFLYGVGHRGKCRWPFQVWVPFKVLGFPACPYWTTKPSSFPLRI